MNDIRSILNLLERKAYKLGSDGKMNNVNVDRSQPKIQIKNRDGEVFDLHGESEDVLKKYIANKNGWEVFEKGKGEASKGGNEKLDAIVAKYAKPGMSLDDVAKMEQEAGSRTNSAYVLAHAARTLGLDGLYRANGKGFCYLEGKEVKTAGGANRQQMEDIAEAGLLPQSKIDQAKKVAEKYKESDPEKSERFQKVVDKAEGETAKGNEEPKLGTNQKLEDAKAKYKEFMELLNKAKADLKSKKESYKPRSYADQLLEQYYLTEALTDEEADRLQQLADELGAMPEFGDDLDDQIADALNMHGMWKRDYEAQFKDQGDDEKETAMDYSSDEAIKQAIDDVESWIANEFPKELESKQAKGLLKATNRGKIKSASAAAIQTVLMRIGTATNNEELKKIKADGFYGPASIAGVKRAQEIAGIKVDGDPGADTARELLAYSKDPQKGIDDAMKDDFARIEELIAKSKEETPPPGQENTGFDMRSMLETLSKLNEALTADEFKELRGLLDKHRAKLEDPETAQAYSQYADIFKTADAIKDPETAKGDESPPPPPEEVTNHDELADALYAAGYKMFGTDEEKIYRYLEKIKDKASYDKVAGIYQTKYKRKDMTADLQAEMSGQELEQLNQILGKLGVGPNAGGGQGKVNAAGIFAIPDASRAELKLDDKLPKFANTKLTPNGAAFYIYHDSAGKTSGPTIKVDSPEGQKLTKMIQDAGGKIINPAAEKPKGDEVPKTPQGMDPNKLANPKPEGPGPLAKKAPTQQQLDKRANTMAFQSKDYSMKNPINEAASMNISMSGDNAGEVGELLKILKNAGMEDAAPVGAVNLPMDTEMPAEPQGPMPCATCGGDHDADTPCGGGEEWDNSPDEGYGELSDIVKLSGGPNSNKNPGDIRVKDPSPYEDVEEDGWDNSPDEEYKDDDYMYQSGGIHKKKKSHPPVAGGDNPMALENSIKAQLYKALEEKLQNK